MKNLGLKLGLGIALILGIILILKKSNSSQDQINALSQDKFIQVYFNNNQAKKAEYIEPYRHIKRKGDNLEQIIIDNINSANSTINLAVQELNLPNIANALIKASKSGVKVQIIVENTYNKIDDQNEALLLLKSANIPIIDDTEDGSKGSGLMHNKFIIIDNKKVVTGSANFSYSDIHGDFDKLETRGNANHILVINNQELANIFTQEFNLLWGDGLGGKKDSLFGLQKPDSLPTTINVGDSKITVKFSPTSKSKSFYETTNGLIVENINNSLYSIDLALFVFSDQQIANSLQEKNNNLVKIRALIDKNFAFQYYSEGLDLLGVELLSNKCKIEKDNNVWQNPLKTVGVSNLAEGDKLHHKFAVIDNNKVITGSHNWSASANYLNDETLLVIENNTINKHFEREFERLYSDSTLGIPLYIQDRIQQNKQKCRY